MRILGFLALFLTLSGHTAPSSKNPVSRYFRRVPIERAHLTWGEAQLSELSGDSLDVLVWNVKKGARETFGSELIRLGENKDIFLIQEAFTSDLFIQNISYFTNYQWDLGISFTYRLYDNNGTGNMIGARVKPSWVKVEHTIDLEPVTQTPKTTAFAKYPVSGRAEELLVISIHGINFTSFQAFARHLEQVRAEIAGHKGPVILAGDFNTRTKERMAQVRTFTKELNLAEVKFVNGNLRMTAVGSNNILDHAFLKGFTVRHAEVFPSKGSDHQPLVLNLNFL